MYIPFSVVALLPTDKVITMLVVVRRRMAGLAQQQLSSTHGDGTKHRAESVTERNYTWRPCAKPYDADRT